MIGQFRIVPRLKRERAKNGSRYGFVIPNHPLGISTPKQPSFFKSGDYVASWETWEEAVCAAGCVGVSPYEIHRVYLAVPEIQS